MTGMASQAGCVKEAAASVPSITGITFAAGTPNTGTVACTAHGLRVGDIVTLSGATPSAWNGSFAVQNVPTANSFVIYQPTTTTNTTVQPTATATAYGVAGTVSRFWEFVSEGVELLAPPIMSEAVRNQNRVLRSDRFVPDRQGARGPVRLEVKTKGFGYLLSELMGSVATTGPTDSTYTHTGTIPSGAGMQGKSTTWQFGRPLVGSTYVAPYTYPGCKVIDWEFSAAIGGKLMLNMTLDALDEIVSPALAVPSYPSGDELITFAGGLVTIGGTAYDVGDVTIGCTMGYNTERRAQRQNTLGKEPLEAEMRKYSISFGAEFLDQTIANRFAAATAAGRTAAVVCTWRGPTLLGTTTYPSITFTMPAVRFDGANPKVEGAGLINLSVTGEPMNTTAGNDAMTIAYATADSTP